MRKWVAALLLLTLMPSAYAVERELKRAVEYCQNTALLAEQIIARRMGGYKKQEMLEKARGDSLAVQFIEVAYSLPEIDDATELAETVIFFRNTVYQDCLEKTLND
ncbi:MAG: hypothetical protein KA735_13055 [Burkholderiaceae bacterium]|nr:hypothetical protein [Burkholderiaceae bacterium]